MDYELRKLGNRVMQELHREYSDAVSDGGPGSDPVENSIDVLDGMNNVEMLAVMYATATVRDAFLNVADEVAECIRNHDWAFQ